MKERDEGEGGREDWRKEKRRGRGEKREGIER